MPEAKIRVALLWHMHQPYYKDLVANQYRLPWTRLHAMKDYYGMVAMLEEFPRIHMTFNLVPSLLAQMEEYAEGKAQEAMQDLAYRPAESLAHDEKVYLLRYFFQANPEHLIGRYPRYEELYDLAQASGENLERAVPFFRKEDYTDLQVLSQLAWLDEIYLDRDAELQALVNQGAGFDETDQQVIQKKQQQLLKETFKAYRAAASRGQIEISTSPYYHPILPLICDSNIAAEAHPGVRLPRRRYQHPEDARLQLERAIELHRRMFGVKPSGLWPSEGSLSEEVLQMCAALGFRWTATDQRVLGNSLGISFFHDPAGSMVNAERLYTPYEYQAASGSIHLIFRDQELSDRIGFVYSQTESRAGALDLIQRIKQSALPVTRQGKNALVSIILDGENAWEYYDRNGRPFLRALYGMLAEDADIECVTVTEALERHESEKLHRLAPGSWINANFDVWIGAHEDNVAWDYLADARDFFAEHEKSATVEQRTLALEELQVAEGSDWNWWYGPEHSSANDADFDALYRSHLANVYRGLGHHPPDALAQPIARTRQRVISVPPECEIKPNIDGRVSNYFEWLGAGLYSPVRTSGTMHGQKIMMQEIYYGRDQENFYLRIDFQEIAHLASGQYEMRVSVRNEPEKVMVIGFKRESIGADVQCIIQIESQGKRSEENRCKAAINRVLEVKIPLSMWKLDPGGQIEFQVTVWEKDFPLESFPLEGWLAAPAPI
ncbi:MAG: hypothetical protein A3F68_05980 [Acidobacteria bacterium RIFCSPLOWO2_12_FULL_54_10]|nr:MAG: hypothetical protein A3F68_05980 [Acidobacteria bacterium RIFCSPLOWO2_12_FULL_54_10]